MSLTVVKPYLSDLFDKCRIWDMKAILEGALSDYSPAEGGNFNRMISKGLKMMPLKGL